MGVGRPVLGPSALPPMPPSAPLLVLLLACLSGTAVGEEWNYLQHGRDWGGECALGRRQSPVNFDTSMLQEVAGGSPIHFHNYNRNVLVNVIVDTPHYTIKVTPQGGHDMTISGGGLPGTYKLDSLHFHWPGEHTVDSHRFIMEAHLVHIKNIYNSTTEAAADPEGIAVLGVLYTEGKDNHELFKIETGAKEGQVELNFEQLLPYDKSEFYRYLGSLTTPGCSEAVVWTVFKNYVSASPLQVAAFRGLLPEEDQTVDTYRELQPLNGRTVQFWSTSQLGLNRVNYVTASPHTSILFALIPGLSNSIQLPKLLKNY